MTFSILALDKIRLFSIYTRFCSPVRMVIRKIEITINVDEERGYGESPNPPLMEMFTSTTIMEDSLGIPERSKNRSTI